jgi:glycosyltransferase involved in cell wall biosynthesis
VIENEIETSTSTAPAISVVVPVYNEEENIVPLHGKIDEALRQIGLTYEILYVDDGSRDKSFGLLCDIASKDDFGATSVRLRPWQQA